MRRGLLAAFVGIAILSCVACAGSRGFVPAQTNEPGVLDAATGTTKVTVTITVATKSAPAQERRDRRSHYFSAASQGLSIDAYLHGKTTIIGKAAVDISPGSAACGGKKTTPRTCSAALMLAPSKGDDFLIYDYNVKPKSGKFAKTAKLLAYGKLTNKKIAASAKKNVFNVFLGGVIAKLGATPAAISFAGDAQKHSAALMIDPTDYGNKPIAAGTKDPYANPITVSFTETGGAGHTSLSLDGAAGATSVTLRHSTDTVEVEYDGGGAIGYGATVRLTAAKVGKAGGATAAVVIAPLLLASTSADLSTGALALKGNGDYVKIQIGELGAPAGTTFTAAAQHCNAIESTMPVQQPSATAGSFAVIARQLTVATPNPEGCAVAVTDGTSSVDLVVSNTYTGGAETAITGTPTPTQFSGPIEINEGPDGAMWFAENCVDRLGRIQATGTNPQATEFPLPAAASSSSTGVIGVNAGPDGKVWWTDRTATRVGNMTTSGAGTQYVVSSPSPPTPQPYMIVAGSDDTMWFAEYGGQAIGQITTAGVLTQHSRLASGTGSAPYVALGPDGNVWFTDDVSSAVGYITPGGTVVHIPTPTGNARPWGITAGPDGAMWFTECNGGPPFDGSGVGAIARVPIGATSTSQITEHYTGLPGTQPNDITVGPDGALWFTYCGKGSSGTLNGKFGVGRMDTSFNVTDYVEPAGAIAPTTGIASGPDGAIWFTETNSSFIGRVALATSSAFRWPHVARRRHSP